MAKNPITPQAQELADLRKQLEWLDEERRKSSRKFAELEQKLEVRERDVSAARPAHQIT